MFGKVEGLEAAKPEEMKKFVVALIDTERERPQLIDTAAWKSGAGFYNAKL